MKKNVPVDSILMPDSARLVFEGEIFSVFQWDQELYDGTKVTFEMLRRPDTTAVIGVVGDKILVLDDEQPNRAMKKSFPGGRVDPEDVDIIAAAKREMLEETGYEFDNWRVVAVEQHAGKIEWFVHTLIAWGGRKIAEPKLDAGERITVRLESFDEVKQRAEAGEGHIGESVLLLQNLTNIEDILALPEFKGMEVER